MCLNRKVLVGMAVAVGVLFIAVPNVLGRLLPLLLLAACPISMVLMMKAMSGAARGREEQTVESPAVSAESEIARLRAEVDQLRAAQADLNPGLRRSRD